MPSRTTAGGPAASTLPKLVRPMLATPGQLPSSAEDAGWGYEFKWDGVRAVAYLHGADGGPLRLVSRNDRDIARSYPELAGLSGALPGRAVVLDGEIVAFDARGVTSFGRLQQRMHVQDPPRDLVEAVPVVYVVFDVLHLDGASTLTLPYQRRRELLDGLGLDGDRWKVPPSFAGGGMDVLEASRSQLMEGILAKRLASPYRPGARSPDWRKIKHVRTQEVVVAGWRPGGGRRQGMIGSLILGVPGPSGDLEYVGGVGTGFTQAMLRDLAAQLAPLAHPTAPFTGRLTTAELRDAHWVQPRLVGEVVFTEWTGDGHLRHPSWRGLRPDKEPDDVARES